jgi:hypothetical protein
MDVWVGPNVGRIVRGHLFDTDKEAFDRALRFHDPLLYSVWNTEKFHGRGCWEIRRRPEFNTIVDVTSYEGCEIFILAPKEYDLVHHVLDTQFLNYDIIRYLKQQDTFQYGGNTSEERAAKWQAEVERRTAQTRQLAMENGLKRRSEAARTFKNEIKAFKEYVQNGGNPHLIAAHWDRVKELE